jgi:hypothetical protein
VTDESEKMEAKEIKENNRHCSYRTTKPVSK